MQRYFFTYICGAGRHILIYQMASPLFRHASLICLPYRSVRGLLSYGLRIGLFLWEDDIPWSRMPATVIGKTGVSVLFQPGPSDKEMVLGLEN
jgi:hypothetical protein